MLKLGNKSISNLFIGQKAATKAFLGQKLVWQKTTGLPYDAEVEYLESTGTQWIDTGIRPAQNLSFAVEFNNLNVNVGYGNVFGSRLGSNNNEYQVTLYNGGSVGVGTRYSGLRFYANEINTIIYNGIDELNINGTVKKIVPQSCELANGNILLFGISQNGVETQLANCRIYNVKFGNVRDMIPVRKGGVGYMYDRVSKQLFGNQGSGNFIVGPDVVEVEYLESTGTQWIDTGVSYDDFTDIGYEIKLNPLDSVAMSIENSFCGYSNYGSRWFGVNFTTQLSRGIQIGLGSNSLYTGETSIKDYTIKVSSTDGVFLDGVDTGATYNSNVSRSGTTFLLFAICGRDSSNVNHINPRKCRIYSFKIYSGTKVIQDMIPVRVGMEGAMMDRLTRKIYHNQGTGAFKIGADRKETPLMCNSYVKDGLVAMWDGTENAGWGTHDASATTWKDLIGTDDFTVTANAHWSDNGIDNFATAYRIAYRSSFTFNAPLTQEVVFWFKGGQGSQHNGIMLHIP